MTIKEFQAEKAKILSGASMFDVYTSSDFQCDQTDGAPTALCAYWKKGKAWLVLNNEALGDEKNIANLQQDCADFGIRDCLNENDFNGLLKELGEDAYQSAYLESDSDQIFNEGMMM